MGCHSNYNKETTVPSFSCLTKDENHKNKWIRFIDRKDQQSVVCISHFEDNFFKKMAKRRGGLDK